MVGDALCATTRKLRLKIRDGIFETILQYCVEQKSLSVGQISSSSVQVCGCYCKHVYGCHFFWTTCMLIPSDVEVQNLARWEKFCGLNWIGSTIGALAACHVLRNLTCRVHVERGKFFAGRTELLPCHECLWPQKNCTGGTLVQWCFNWRTGVLVPAAEYGLTAIHNTQLTAICHDNPGKPAVLVSMSTGSGRRAKLQSNLHHQQTNTQPFTGRMSFLLSNQQCSVKALKGNDPSRSLKVVPFDKMCMVSY